MKYKENKRMNRKTKVLGMKEKLYSIALLVLLTSVFMGCSSTDKQVPLENLNTIMPKEQLEETEPEPTNRQVQNTAKIKETKQPESTKQAGTSNEIIKNEILGFTIQFSEKLSNKIKYTSNLKRQDNDFGMELNYVEFYIELEGKKQPLFTIYQIDGKMTETDIEKVNPEMGYLASSDIATYTIEYATEPESGLSREREQEFEVLMGEVVEEISKTFQVIE